MPSHGTNKRFHYEKQDRSKLLCRTILISYTDIELEIIVSNCPPRFQQPTAFMFADCFGSDCGPEIYR